MPTWTRSLEIGVAGIDEEHQRLFHRFDTLLEAMKQRRPAEEIEPLVQFLGEHCSRHFRSEEDLMREQGHARFDEHRTQHAVLIERFQDIVQQFAAKGPSAGVTVELQEFLGQIVAHIRSEDVNLARSGPAAVASIHVARESTAQTEAGGSGAGPGENRGVADRPKRTRGSSHPFEPVFLQHGGRRILRLDFSGLSRDELLDAFERAGRLIALEPFKSLRILTVLSSSLDRGCADGLKCLALRNAPHVLASAIVATHFWGVIVSDLQVRGREDLKLFDDEAAALNWLAIACS